MVIAQVLDNINKLNEQTSSSFYSNKEFNFHNTDKINIKALQGFVYPEKNLNIKEISEIQKAIKVKLFKMKYELNEYLNEIFEPEDQKDKPFDFGELYYICRDNKPTEIKINKKKRL